MENAKIMIVEDEKIVARDIQNRLRTLGYDVLAIVSSGEEAIRKAKEIKPDLVLMDIVLKGKIDGIAAAREISNSFDIPVIYLTAYSDQETLGRVKSTAPFGYIHKPFQVKEMRSCIEIALHKHQIDKKLKDKKKWLAWTLKSITDGVISTDSHEVITFMNPIAGDLIQCRVEDSIGKPLSEVFQIKTAEKPSLARNLGKRATEDGVKGGSKEHRVILRTKAGKEILIETSSSPIRDQNGVTTGKVFVFRKVAGLKKYEPGHAGAKPHEQIGKIRLTVVCSTIFREGIRKILEAEEDIEIIAEAFSGQNINALVEQTKPNILLVDTAIINSAVGELMEQVSEKSPRTKVLLLLHTADEEEVIRSLSAGARGCLTDVSNKEHLVQAIRTVNRDSIWVEMTSITSVLTRLLPTKKGKHNLKVKLTKREEEIVNLIAMGYSNKQISNTLFISENTVKTHLANIFSKFGVANRLQLVKHMF